MQTPPDSQGPGTGEDRELETWLPHAVGGDRDAIDAVFAQVAPQVLSRIRRRMGRRLGTRVDAEDLLQSTMLAAARDLPGRSFATPRAFRAWMLRVADSQVAMAGRYHGAQKREAGREEPLPAAGVHADAATPSEIVRRQESVDILRLRLEGLTREERDLLMLRAVDNLRFEEIARHLGMGSRGAARHHYQRIVEKLARTLRRGSHSLSG